MEARKSIQLASSMEILRRLTGASAHAGAPIELEQPIEVQDLDGTSEFHAGDMADEPHLDAPSGIPPPAFYNAVEAGVCVCVS